MKEASLAASVSQVRIVVLFCHGWMRARAMAKAEKRAQMRMVALTVGEEVARCAL
jgi:hypothetical protein